ncbi:nicotinamide riboside kinase 1-like [Prorops nasuta]|uniref:nicotinamide riboside kinase 1-like n=1 Tax=Prorops nasuta TaxID=863751 RepID=UPI0034CE2FF3
MLFSFAVKMATQSWLIIGISGVTCSGKTTLVKRLQESLDCIVISQDNYFLPANDPRHTKVPELNHLNWDILSSLDMKKMYEEVLNIIEPKDIPNDAMNKDIIKKKTLILEGFSIFGDKSTANLCNLKYFLTLSKEECWTRRKCRVYDPPDVPGYFEKIVWPEYLKHMAELQEDKYLYKKIKFIDGLKSRDELFELIYSDICMHLC